MKTTFRKKQSISVIFEDFYLIKYIDFIDKKEYHIHYYLL